MGIYYLLSVFSGITIAMCVFIIMYSLINSQEKTTKKYILSVLIFAITLRILKSIAYYVMIANSDYISVLGVALGFLGYSMIGPLLYFYYKSISTKNINVLSPKESFHYLIPLVGTISILFLQNYFSSFYLLAGFFLLIYLSYIYFRFLFKKDKSIVISAFDRVLFYSISILLLIFLSQNFIEKIQIYVIGTALASLVFTFVFFFLLKYPPPQASLLSTKSPRIKQEQKEIVISSIEEDEIYKTVGLTLNSFSESIKIPQYIIKAVIKERYNKSFPGLVNFLRINDVKIKLSNPDFINTKIENLAYDAGFNTVSSFYTAFKKETNMSPREYQNTLLYK